MAKKGGVSKELKQHITRLGTIVKAYNVALTKFGKDLEEMQSNGENGNPVWNGKRAKAWLTAAIAEYNRNVKDLKQLSAAYTEFYKLAFEVSKYDEFQRNMNMY